MHPPHRSPLSLALFTLTAALILPLISASLVTAQQPAPTATATPSPTPTTTPAQIVGIQAPIDAGAELVRQVGLGGTLLLLIVAAAFFIVSSAAKKAGESIGEYLYATVLGRHLKRREQDVEQHAQQQRATHQREEAQRAGLGPYLAWLREELKHLPIIPIKSTERQEQLLIEDVYVPLRVVERNQIESFHRLLRGDFNLVGEYQVRREAFQALKASHGVYRLLSDALEAPLPNDETRTLRESDDSNEQNMLSSYLLLIGDAGSGKTTTLQYGALVLALDRQQGWQQGARTLLDLHCSQPLVPIYIRLTLVATYVREAQQRAVPTDLPRLHGAPSELLLTWLDIYTHAQVGKINQDIPTDLASRLIATGNCLVMLDGLDETGDAHERDYMQRLIANLVQDYPQNRYLVTSRPFEDLRLTGFIERHLSPLNRKEIELLLRNWFGAARKTVSRRVNEYDEVSYLLGILDENARLFEMATNPLLITSMALLVQTGVGLPRERAELYNRLVYLLLDTWRTQQVTGGVPGRLTGQNRRYGGEESVPGVQRRLQELASYMMERGRREIRLAEAQQQLRPVYRRLKGWDEEQADDYITVLLESLALESGLIQQRDGRYSFAHFTLQEYLTARAYDTRQDGVQELLRQWHRPRWRETILLAVGHWATSNNPEKAERLVRELLDVGGRQASAALFLAAVALDDADASRVVELAPLRELTVERLRANSFDPTHRPDPSQRNRAATMLDRLEADMERPGLVLEHEHYWAQWIEAGVFQMGDDESAQNDEKPAFAYHIRQPYAVARYPVTNRQYLRFLENLKQKGMHDEAQRRRPRWWPGQHYPTGEGNFPVVGVCWDDAVRFAEWACETFLTKEQRAVGEVIRLPSEPEWERAAAYRIRLYNGKLSYRRSIYPWDSNSELTRTTQSSKLIAMPANTQESRIGSPSVVGIFPQGAADCGAEDLVGNVWEWCASGYHPYPLPDDDEMLFVPGKHGTYVLRGSSWRDDQSDVRAGYRLFSLPTNFLDNVGFRLVRSFALPSHATKS
jgi:formylglycine-generating enzyme required for sulfatase activity